MFPGKLESVAITTGDSVSSEITVILFIICDEYVRTKICKGTNCAYRHPKPCRNVKIGVTCNWGQNCLYLHNITIEASQREEDSNADEITYSCDICETTYDCPSDLNTHNAMHERSESYSCDQSEYESTSNCLLPQHAMTSHPTLSCDECEFTAKNKGGLTRHRNAQHKNSKKCEEPSSNNLDNPSATSEPSKPSEQVYKFDECDYQSGFEYHVNSHIKDFHRADPVGLYEDLQEQENVDVD